MPFLNSEDEIVGELTDKARPHVDLPILVSGQIKRLRCHIDTGSDDGLVFSDLVFAERLGLTFRSGPRAPRVERQLPDGAFVPFVTGGATVQWFGEKQISILAPDPLGSYQSSRQSISMVLLGLPMLSGTELILQFYGEPGTVRITNRKL